MLKFNNSALRRGIRLLFEQTSLTIHRGNKVGVSGANGVGKSSLFALIRGELTLDEGEFEQPGDLVIAHVAQETPASDDSALEYVMAGDQALCRLQRAIEQAEASDDGLQLAELHARLEQIDGYTAHSRAVRLMSGLGFAVGDEKRPVRSFSGGWRVRLNVAQALMCRSDLLLLDEPTNHLDLDAVIWLQEWLASYPGTLLLISHDRDFLDDVVDHIAHLEQQRLTLYTGNYSGFEALRAEKIAQQAAAYSKQQREMAHIRQFVNRFRAQATKARQVQSRIKAMEKLALISQAHVDSPFDFAFRKPNSVPDPLLRLDDVDAGYGEQRILQQVGLSIQPGARLGLLGRNGAGKSTLIKLLAGELSPLAGKRRAAEQLKIGYFAQHQLEQLRLDESPLQHLQHLDRQATEKELRNFLGGFAFVGDMALAQVAPFSGGEKARLVLALLAYQQPNLLLLDEPTNHLDIELRHALNLALQEFVGAVVLVSHDRHLIRTVCDQLLLVSDGKVEPYSGDLEDYRRWLIEQRQQQLPTEPKKGNGRSRKEQKRIEAEQRKQRKPLQNALRRAEKAVERLLEAQQQLDHQLADSALYEPAVKEQLKALLNDKAGLDQKLAEAEAEWMMAEEALEQNGCRWPHLTIE